MKGQNRLWILKNTQNVRKSELIGIIDPDGGEMCFIEPFLDFPLLQTFPKAKAIYFANDLISLIDQSQSVVSMPYHGCILAMLRSKPVVGLYEQKSLDLLTRYDLRRFFVLVAQPFQIPMISGRPLPRSSGIKKYFARSSLRYCLYCRRGRTSSTPEDQRDRAFGEDPGGAAGVCLGARR
jgi:hypothetical protein